MDLPEAPASKRAQLRGNYAEARADYTVEQHYERYGPAEHHRWAQLLRRQSALLPNYAAPQFIAGLHSLQLGDQVPDFDRTSMLLRRSTRWELVAVPGLIPEREFFAHLAHRRFPVTVWLRRADEIDYLAEPDLFHDFFGHVPLLTNPAYAEFVELYGHAGQRAIELGGLKMLARLYWYGIEFGLIETAQGLRTYGAGILSSYSEARYAIESPVPLRIRFDLQRVLRSDYLIDDLQRNYFVVRDFQDLVDAAVNTDFAPIYTRYRDQPGITVGTRLTTDVIVGADQ